MPRPSNYRRSGTKAGKHVHHDLPEDVKNARETNRPPRKNMGIHETRSTRLSTSPSSSPISKEAARPMKIDRQAEKEMESSANLRELIERSIKTTMLSVADEFRLRKKNRLGETKMEKIKSRKGRSRNKGLIRKGQDKESLSHRSRSVYTRSHPTKRQENSKKSSDRNKHSKNRSKSEDTRITDNRKMTGNVNIFICSEATDVSQARNKPSDPPRSVRETSSYLTSEISNSELDQSTTSSSLPESDETSHKTEIQNSQRYKTTGSDISSPTSPENPEDSNYPKQLKLESKVAANHASKEPVESAQCIVNLDRPNTRSLGRYRSVIDRSDLSFFNSKLARDNEPTLSRIQPSRNLASSPVSEPLKSNVEVARSWRNQRSPDWRRRKDSPHKLSCVRNQKFVVDRNDECTRRHCKRKFVPCPFLGPEKRSLLCSACNRCPVQEESLDFIENTSRELQTRMSGNTCNKGDVNNYGNIKKSERLAEERVTSVVEYAGNIGRVETGVIADSKNLDSKSRVNESAIDVIDVKEANNVQNPPTNQTTDAPENEKLAKVKSDEVGVKLTELVESRAKENDQVPKKPEPPPQPPKVESPPNNPAAKNLLKLVRVIDRKNIAKATKTTHEVPRVAGRPTPNRLQQIKSSPVIKHKLPQKNKLPKLQEKGQKQVGAKAMKESAKRFIRARAGIAKASERQKFDAPENKQVQSRKVAASKNMRSKQIVKRNDSQPVRPKSFKERLRASLFCRTILKVLNRLKCRSKKEAAKKTESTEKSSIDAAVTEEDNRAAKSGGNSQSRIRASRQDRRRVRSVVRRPAVSRPADNKKHTTAADFPARKQKTPQDKKDASGDVTATDNPAIVDGPMESKRKDADPNSRGRVKPKLLTSIATKRTSLAIGQKVLPGSTKIEEKPEETLSKVDDEPSKDKTHEDSGFLKIDEEKTSPDKETKSPEQDSQTPKSKDSPGSTQTDQTKVPLSEKGGSIVEPRMEVKSARQSVAAKDKIDSESMEVRVPQSGAVKVETVGTNAPVAAQVPPQIIHEVKLSEEICDQAKCSLYPKSCLKRPKNLSNRESHCECKPGSVYIERRRLDARCDCGGCHKRHLGALNYADNISKRERHRCTRTLVCLYCDRPRNNCICRTTPRLCACCELSGDLCKSQEQCYHHRIPKPKREPHHLKRDKHEAGISDECRCCERIKYPQTNNPPCEQSSLEHDITKERTCQVCGEASCTCDRTVKVDDRSKARKNPRDSPIRWKCEHCLLVGGCKRERAQLKEIKYKCCYSESSVCT